MLTKKSLDTVLAEDRALRKELILRKGLFEVIWYGEVEYSGRSVIKALRAYNAIVEGMLDE